MFTDLFSTSKVTMESYPRLAARYGSVTIRRVRYRINSAPEEGTVYIVFMGNSRHAFCDVTNGRRDEKFPRLSVFVLIHPKT